MGGLGRFTSRDPVKRSLNDYEYAGQDPVNAYDLTGTCSKHFGWACAAWMYMAGGAKAIRRFIMRLYGAVARIIRRVADEVRALGREALRYQPEVQRIVQDGYSVLDGIRNSLLALAAGQIELAALFGSVAAYSFWDLTRAQREFETRASFR